MPHRALLLLATLGAAACTTLTAEQRGAACRATDWASYGQNDGILGVATAERVEKFTDCAELGYPVDIAAYQAGRAQGLESYCTVENGYEVGRSGRIYENVCPADSQPGFLQGYEKGRDDRPTRYLYPGYGFGYGFGYGYGYPYPYYGFGHAGRHHGFRHHRGHGGFGHGGRRHGGRH
jgi:hypothetical protein